MINVETMIEELALDIWKNYKYMSRADLIRRMQQIKRATAESCAEITESRYEKIAYDTLFENERPGKDIVYDIANDIRNIFLS